MKYSTIQYIIIYNIIQYNIIYKIENKIKYVIHIQSGSMYNSFGKSMK